VLPPKPCPREEERGSGLVCLPFRALFVGDGTREEEGAAADQKTQGGGRVSELYVFRRLRGLSSDRPDLRATGAVGPRVSPRIAFRPLSCPLLAPTFGVLALLLLTR
jgi:hypothetical protein